VGLNDGVEDDHPEASWPLPGADPLRAELLAAYDEPGRRYHDRHHLSGVLRRLDQLAALGARFDALPTRLAAWFHDAVYDGERDAEERSAAWAEVALPAHVEPAVVAEVARLVRLTESHDPEPDDDNGAALSDADLGVLALPEPAYAAYAAGVRAEYGHLPDDVFAEGRTEVLSGLLARPVLFRTEAGRRLWDEAARANMAAELERLRSLSPRAATR
jgi:predicted metal-dependent HD superfamily phosphohydrolase